MNYKYLNNHSITKSLLDCIPPPGEFFTGRKFNILMSFFFLGEKMDNDLTSKDISIKVIKYLENYCLIKGNIHGN